MIEYSIPNKIKFYYIYLAGWFFSLRSHRNTYLMYQIMHKAYKAYVIHIYAIHNDMRDDWIIMFLLLSRILLLLIG